MDVFWNSFRFRWDNASFVQKQNVMKITFCFCFFFWRKHWQTSGRDFGADVPRRQHLSCLETIKNLQCRWPAWFRLPRTYFVLLLICWHRAATGWKRTWETSAEIGCKLWTFLQGDCWPKTLSSPFLGFFCEFCLLFCISILLLGTFSLGLKKLLLYSS